MSDAYRADGTTIYSTDTGMPFTVAFREAGGDIRGGANFR